VVNSLKWMDLSPLLFKIVYISTLSFGVLVINYIIIRVFIFSKGIMRYCVKTHDRLKRAGLARLTIQEGYIPHLVWILDENVFPFRVLHAKINNSPDDPPSIIQGHVQLCCKVTGTHGCCAENDMSTIVTSTCSGYVTRVVMSMSLLKNIKTYPSFMTSAPARILCTAQRAILKLLFFISVATTAPL
jgi:hypothetical protein